MNEKTPHPLPPQESSGAAAGGRIGALTLDRGVRVLQLLAEGGRDFPVAEIAATLGMHRQAVYRLLHTLEAHNLAVRTESGRFRLGLGVLRLSALAGTTLRRSVTPHLHELARALGATAQCVIAEGSDGVALCVVEPDDDVFHLWQRPGARHRLGEGASGLAILAGRPPEEGEPAAVTRGRKDGYVVTRGQPTPGAISVAAPLRDLVGRGLGASVGVISLRHLDVADAAQRILTVAAKVVAPAE